MFERTNASIQRAENLEYVYFSIKVKPEAMHYLKIYLDPTKDYDSQKKIDPKLYNKCKYKREITSQEKIFGRHIMQWSEKNPKSSIATIKYNPNDEYQLMVQFQTKDKRILKKGSKTRKILEEFLSVCQATQLYCGYIHHYKQNVIIQYDGKNFSLKAPKHIRDELIEPEINKQREQIDSLRTKNIQP